MKLILSDKYLNLDVSDHSNTKFIDLSSLNIANCTGCFGCWTKTPGKCVIRDDATKVYPYIAKSDNLIYISKILYGGYDTPMKTMLERAIPIQKAFIRILNGETHHVQRSVELKNATIIKALVERNAKNMNFKHYKILFTNEQNLEKTVKTEMIKWSE